MGYSREELAKIHASTDGRCQICWKPIALGRYGETWEVDHAIGRARGGTDHLNNLRPAHIPSNRAKRDARTRHRDRTMCLLRWDDYDPKTGTLRVRKEIDKNRFDRTFVVFPETRSILDGMRPDIAPRATFIFGTAKRWAPIKKAAVAAGLGGRRISEHTLRHSRTTELCSGPDADLAAVAYLLVWRDVATLCSRYFHPDKRHADAFVAKVSRK